MLTWVDMHNPTFLKLETLDLSYNKLPQFYLIDVALPELKILRLSHNLLTEFVVYKTDASNLRLLLLESNSLKRLDL